MDTQPAAATLAILALAATLLTGCSGDDGQTDQNPCGDTGKPYTGDSGGTATFDGERQALITKAGGGSGGGKGSGSSSGGGSKSGGSKSGSGGGSSVSRSSSASSAFRNSTVTGSRTFTASNGTKYAVAQRTNFPMRVPFYATPLPSAYRPGMHYSYLTWLMYGNYPGSTRIIECR
ncbi:MULTISPECIES: hypothetical protein [Arthrobacter]|uniref:hypothetical protein n=1 Tax=Arthrobacter TaxID=1663 RepID=UPI00197A8AB8|nr:MULTISPECIES: hypothetical protein [Arthrobacter]MBT8159645.1 hypothetical protein [Arthrobacter sp. GN70]